MKNKFIVSSIAAALLLAACGTPPAATVAPKEVIKEVIKEVPKEVIKEVEKVVEKPVEVIKEVEKIVVATAAAGKTPISLWFHSGTGGERDTIKAQVEAFNKANATYSVVAVELPAGSYTDQVNAGALINQLPCVLDFDGPYLYNYAWGGYLVPMDDLVSADLKADLLPSIVQQGTYNGKLYSVGTFDSGLALWGNKSLLEKAGVRIPKSVDDAWTLDEFEGALAALKKVDGIKFPIDMKFNYGKGEWYPYGFSPILQSFGADLIDRSTYKGAAGTLDSDAAVKAMTTFQGWVKKGYVNAAETKDDTFTVQKTAGLALVGHWIYNDGKKGLGDDLILLPMPKFGDKAVTGMGSWNWGITKGCADANGAAEFLKFILQPDEVLRMTDANGAVPATKSALAKSKLFGDGGPLNIYVQQLSKGVAVPRPVTPGYPAISKAFAEAVDDIAKGGDVKAALSKAAKAIDADIEDNAGYAIK
jgi:multiple sugar transport system substrate-binding protein